MTLDVSDWGTCSSSLETTTTGTFWGRAWWFDDMILPERLCDACPFLVLKITFCGFSSTWPVFWACLYTKPWDMGGNYSEETTGGPIVKSCFFGAKTINPKFQVEEVTRVMNSNSRLGGGCIFSTPTLFGEGYLVDWLCMCFRHTHTCVNMQSQHWRASLFLRSW